LGERAGTASAADTNDPFVAERRAQVMRASEPDIQAA
jgi:hypothetical protein